MLRDAADTFLDEDKEARQDVDQAVGIGISQGTPDGKSLDNPPIIAVRH